jgi:hypothetical protein
MEATSSFSTAFWKSVYTSQEAFEKPSVAPMRLYSTTAVFGSHAAAEKLYVKSLMPKKELLL